MSKISAIVPVYNTEKYLDICLDSILMQTFQDFEIICINDGSEDGSFELLEKYRQFDDRIKILNQENKGASAARNKGLECANGEYVLFIDSDDYISPVMFEKLYNNAKANESDIVSSNLFWLKQEINEGFAWGLTKDNEQFFQRIKKPYFDGKNEDVEVFFSLLPTASAKLFKKNLIENIRFQEGLIFEDSLFFTECYLKANRISYDTESYYYYRQQKNSVMQTCDKRFRDIFKIKDMQAEIFKKYGLYEKFKTELLIQKMSETIERTLSAKEEFQEEMFNLLKENFKDLDYSEYDIKKISKVKNFYALEQIIRMDFKDFINLAKRLKGEQ